MIACNCCSMLCSHPGVLEPGDFPIFLCDECTQALFCLRVNDDRHAKLERRARR